VRAGLAASSIALELEVRMMRLAKVLLLVVVTGAVLLTAQEKTTKSLEIWVIDTEGGKAALYVSPTGQTALIDTGFPGDRDLERIMAAIADAGVKRIDYLISTHYHVDHIGSLTELAKRIPIGTFVDHGPTVEGPNVPQVPPGADGLPITKPREQVEGFQDAYAELYTKRKRLVVKPGDRVPITGLDWRIVTSAGNLLKTPLSGGGRANPYCANFTPLSGATGLVDPDDAQSVGSVISLGEFRALDFGDLWRTKELELMCPTNPIGTVDVYFATGHGSAACGSLPLVHAIEPRVAVMQNGTRKGGAPGPMQTILSSPRLEALWQMHWSHNAMLEQNSPGLFIANIDDMPTTAGVLTAPPRSGGPGGRQGGPAAAGPGAAQTVGATPAPAASPAVATAAPSGQLPAGAPATGRGRGPATGHTPANWLRISAQADGSFTVTNSRNGFSKTYAARTPARPVR
jgi:beta-lactamase superfamily II metal-dependent hydrolase